MSRIRHFLKRLTLPTITNRAELVRYIILVNVFGLVIALALDVTQQLLFFTTWATAVRSWVLTVLAVGVIATPVALVFGLAQRDLQRAKQELEILSRTDSLTGLANRRALMEAGEADSSQALILVIVDVDRFKSVNDRYGHRAGDTVLRTVGRIMAAHLEKHGLVGRLGGEEFALISSETALGPVVQALDRLLKAVAQTPVVSSGAVIHVTLSAGIAIRDPSEPFEKLYSEADSALYRAKHAGRNQIALSGRARDSVPATDCMTFQ